MKSKTVIGFKPEEKLGRLFDDAVRELELDKTALAERAFALGLEPALVEMVQRREESLERFRKKEKTFTKKLAFNAADAAALAEH